MSRLLSLDVMRGLTVAAMILVNNGYGESFQMLCHSRWNGLTPCDLVFPFFLFIVGVACYLSLAKSKFTPTPALLRKIVRRTLLLFLIGLAINWFEHAVGGDVFCFAHLRIWGVMQRIALCYFCVSLFALYVPHRHTIAVVAFLLAVYVIIIVWGHGYAEDAQLNILARVDLRLFGFDHLYHKSPVDPEGLVSTISAVAHTLLGFLCGQLLTSRQSTPQKTLAVLTLGAVLLIGGVLLSFGLPLNKRIWSPSYVLVTCGLAALVLSLLLLLIDIRGYRRWAHPFRVFGMNALALYVSSELLAIVFRHFGVSDLLYVALHAIIPPLRWASLAYALTFVLINYALGYMLYRKNIFIKL